MTSIPQLEALTEQITQLVSELDDEAGQVWEALLSNTQSYRLRELSNFSDATLEMLLTRVALQPASQYLIERLLTYQSRRLAIGDNTALTMHEIRGHHYHRYTFALAELLGHLPLGKMLPDVRAHLVHAGEQSLPLTIKGAWLGWSLCDEAEHRLEYALGLSYVGTVLVNNTLLVKVSHGRMAGVALYSAPTKHGFIIPGVWYAPTDEEMREGLVHAFVQGKTRLDTHTPSSWTIIRTLELPDDAIPFDFLREKRSHVQNIPPVMTDGDRSGRRDIYTSRFEQY